MDMDLVDSFFDERADDENTPEMSTNTVDVSLFDKAEPKVKGILSSIGIANDDAEFLISNLRNDYIALSTDDEGNAADTDLAEFTAEIADTMTAFAPDKSDEDLAIAASDIVTAITDKYAMEEPSDEMEDNVSEESFDEVDNDDVDPTFWD